MLMGKHWGAGTLITTATLADGIILEGSRYIYGIGITTIAESGNDAGTIHLHSADGSIDYYHFNAGNQGSASIDNQFSKTQFYAPLGIQLELATTVIGTPGTTFQLTVWHSHQGA